MYVCLDCYLRTIINDYDDIANQINNQAIAIVQLLDIAYFGMKDENAVS